MHKDLTKQKRCKELCGKFIIKQKHTQTSTSIYTCGQQISGK